jgi:hypothetical protein
LLPARRQAIAGDGAEALLFFSPLLERWSISSLLAAVTAAAI